MYEPVGQTVIKILTVVIYLSGITFLLFYLLAWIIVEQGSVVLAVGAGGGSVDIFSCAYHFCLFSPSL